MPHYAIQSDMAEALLHFDFSQLGDGGFGHAVS
jgi:hypothetical protein